MKTPDLNLPLLAERYLTAIRMCADRMFSDYRVEALIVSGTIVRGVPDPASDLDIVVLHSDLFRERLQIWFSDVACEIFVNPPQRIPAYFLEEASDRRPILAHMLATGHILYDPQGSAARLIEDARNVLAAPSPAASGIDLVLARYSVATEFEDVTDLATRDRAGAQLLLGSVIRNLVECRIKAEPGSLPRAKDLFQTLRVVDPVAAGLVESAMKGEFEERLQFAAQLCEHVTGHRGFFEWKSDRQVLNF